MAIGILMVLLILLPLYCCIVQGKKEEVMIHRLYLEMQEKIVRKDGA